VRHFGPAPAGVSRWSFSWGGEYNVPAKLLGKDGEVYFGYDGSYRSNFSSNPPSIYTWIDGYSLHNFRVGFRVPHGLDISGWVRNATGTNYIQLLTVTSGNTGLIAGSWAIRAPMAARSRCSFKSERGAFPRPFPFAPLAYNRHGCLFS
jgi:outer membrane receptor protein involved in Fe transport